MLKAKVHNAKVMDYEGIKLLLGHAGERFPRLSHLWLDGAYRGEDKGKEWVEKALGWTVELVERPRKPAPEKVLEAWAAEWAKEKAKRSIGTSCSRRAGCKCCLVVGWWNALWPGDLPQPQDGKRL